jgi:hypothetical protein
MKVQKVEARETSKGRGVFARYNIQKDQVVMPYGGILVSIEAILAAREKGENLWWDEYAKSVSGTHALVPRERGDFGGHLVNHSCDPNAKFDGRTIVATRAIPKGEEVTCCYGWLRQREDRECLCEARYCAGIMGVGIVRLDAGHPTDVNIEVRATTVAAVMAAAALNDRPDLYDQYSEGLVLLYAEAGATKTWVDSCAAWALDATRGRLDTERKIMRVLCADDDAARARPAPPPDLTYVDRR